MIKCNKNKFSDVILLNFTYLKRFQIITLETQEVEITLFQCYFTVVTLKQHWIKVISTPCVYRVFIWTPIPTCLWTLGTLCKRDSLVIHLKIRKQLLKVAPSEKLSLNFKSVNINNLQFHPLLLNVLVLYLQFFKPKGF